MTRLAKPVSAATLALMDEMRAVAAPKGDKLDQLRSGIAKLRDLETEKADKEAQVSELGRAIKEMKEKTLVDLFDEAGTNAIGLEAEGNQPAFTCKLDDYYHANIPSDKREEAFDHLRSIGQEDLIKTEFIIAFGLKEGKQADRFRRSLEKAGIAYSEKCGVPWNTLTAWFKAEYQKKPLTVKAMELLGATVGRVVKVVKQKERR